MRFDGLTHPTIDRMFSVAALLLLAPPPVGVVGSALTRAEATQLLAAHAAARREVGVLPLRWSAELAAVAQAHADAIARTGEFAHSGGKYGENLAWAGGDGAEGVVRTGAAGWYAEKKEYTPGAPVPAGPAFAAFKAGHYTQMVWRGTAAVGAGKAQVKTGSLAGGWVLVANYDPPGNRPEKPY